MSNKENPLFANIDAISSGKLYPDTPLHQFSQNLLTIGHSIIDQQNQGDCLYKISEFQNSQRELLYFE